MAVDTRYVTHTKFISLTATETTYPSGRQVASGYDALYRRNAVNDSGAGAGSIAAWQFYGARTATVALGNGVTCSMMTAVGGSGSNAWIQAAGSSRPTITTPTATR